MTSEEWRERVARLESEALYRSQWDQRTSMIIEKHSARILRAEQNISHLERGQHDISHHVQELAAAERIAQKERERAAARVEMLRWMGGAFVILLVLSDAMPSEVADTLKGFMGLP